jgi:type I restriction enzyme, S subunit
MKISFDLKRIIPIYFKFFFESDSVKKSLKEKSHGGTMDILNVGIIKMINIPLPPLSLQQEFADRIAVIEQQKALLQDGLAKMETAYKALMQEYFG